MAQHVPIDPRIEVSGQALRGLFEATKAFLPVINRLFAEQGIAEPRADAWYPISKHLQLLANVAEQVGRHTLLAIGKHITNAIWPPHIKSVEEVLAAIDIAYHMNHRLNGVTMFDPATGKLTEGIGHYRYVAEGPRRARMVCNNVYPSEFDRGILIGVTRQFRSTAEAVRDETQPTRLQGADSCTYIVTW